jgi:hypothetical protein
MSQETVTKLRTAECRECLRCRDKIEKDRQANHCTNVVRVGRNNILAHERSTREVSWETTIRNHLKTLKLLNPLVLKAGSQKVGPSSAHGALADEARLKRRD